MRQQITENPSLIHVLDILWALCTEDCPPGLSPDALFIEVAICKNDEDIGLLETSEVESKPFVCMRPTYKLVQREEVFYLQLIHV